MKSILQHQPLGQFLYNQCS